MNKKAILMCTERLNSVYCDHPGYQMNYSLRKLTLSHQKQRNGLKTPDFAARSPKLLNIKRANLSKVLNLIT